MWQLLSEAPCLVPGASGEIVGRLFLFFSLFLLSSCCLYSTKKKWSYKIWGCNVLRHTDRQTARRIETGLTHRLHGKEGVNCGCSQVHVARGLPVDRWLAGKRLWLAGNHWILGTVSLSVNPNTFFSSTYFFCVWLCTSVSKTRFLKNRQNDWGILAVGFLGQILKKYSTLKF